MGFLMDGLDPEAYDRTYTDRQLVGRILVYFRAQARKMFIVAGAIVLTSLVDTGVPIVISRSLDSLQLDPALSRLVQLAAFVVVVEAEQTPSITLRRAVATIESCPLIMTVLNKARASELEPYGYSYRRAS